MLQMVVCVGRSYVSLGMVQQLPGRLIMEEDPAHL